MTSDTSLTDSSSTEITDIDHGAHEHDHGAHDDHDVSDRQYIYIALMLAVLTAAEVAASYLDLGSWLVPALLVMMVIKFFTVVGYFMHLKFDSRVFSLMFYLGLSLTVALYGVMLMTFHFFAG
jgi:cytochrome c oxidase subunit IV